MPESSPPDVVRALLESRSTVLADVDVAPGAPAAPGGVSGGASERLLVRSDLTGTMQLYELSGGALAELTGLPEPVAGAHYVPGGRQAVLAIDEGGNERHQLYLVDLDAAARATVTRIERLRPLTSDPRFGHHFAGVSPDGRLIAYVSNRGNGIDFDLWVCDLRTGEHRSCYAAGAWCQPASGFSPDGRLASVLCPGERPLDNDLVLVDVDTGDARTVLAHPGEAALVGSPAWVNPDTFYASSNAGRDFSAIVRHDLGARTTTPLSGTGERFDAEVLASRDGRTIAVIENRGGANAITLRDAESGAPGGVVALPEPGVVYHHVIPPPILSADGSRLYYTQSTPRLAGDVFAHDSATGGSRRLTTSPAGVAAGELVSAQDGRMTSFDGEEIPFFSFRPRADEARRPVVVLVHGGPEAQAMLSFNPVIQALVAVGYGVIVPNVRGSTGYGNRYAALDDTTKRLDSVRDLEAVHGSLDACGFDHRRAVLWGGSYGGYMVLAGLAFQPQLWAAGVDIVGISNLVTFLQNTSDYRRAHREREYGSLEHDREFLAAASPLGRADAIRAPLFVIHGRNDPRVPVSEAEQLVDNLSARGIRCTLAVYEDEGHGLARLSNRLDAYPRAIAFLDEVLGR